ncbi:MAG: hypothetical protein A3F53_02270 [Candidatus Zambryskibacteria bacterium RIFCSPHIGHO2_12_FULL_48_10]|nr:MAG: hypothetical protein A3F53_02270 [Candidatus Zambryskibacteria bacterium RIFCSPHIGHO2_12_FULL_48_10]OHB07270.1 MAG: hypothetical protein A3A31_01965 [Candidatus Zambryskibacteria bacterium RIFCSPLOWO2_01_FULL_48_25]
MKKDSSGPATGSFPWTGEIPMKKICFLIMLAVSCFGIVGCSDALKTDVDRYVKGEYGGTVLATSATDGTPVSRIGAVYVVCVNGQVQAVRVFVSDGGDIWTEMLPLNTVTARCGDDLARLVEHETTYANIERVINSGDTPEATVTRIKELIENADDNIGNR